MIPIHFCPGGRSGMPKCTSFARAKCPGPLKTDLLQHPYYTPAGQLLSTPFLKKVFRKIFKKTLDFHPDMMYNLLVRNERG